MKALLRNLLPGSAHNRAVDDMIDANSNNNKDDSKKKKSQRTKSLFSNSSSQIPSSSASATNYHQRVTSQQHHSNTTGCLERPDDSGLEDDEEDYDHQHQLNGSTSHLSVSNVQYPQSLNALSSSFGNGGHQYFNTNISKQSSSSSVQSFSSNSGIDSSLVVQTKSSPNVMQHSPRGSHTSNTGSSSSDNYGQLNGQSSPSPSSSTPGGNSGGNQGNTKRRSSLSNALRRLSLKKSSSANNATHHQQQHSDMSNVIGAPINFADLMMSQSSSTSSIPINNNNNLNNNYNYGGSFSSSNSILSSTASTTTTHNNNNSNYLGYNTNNPDQLLYTPNSPPTSPMSPLSFSSPQQPHHHHQNHHQQHLHQSLNSTLMQPIALSSFTAPTSNLAGTEQAGSSSTNNNSKRKSLNVITVGLSSHHNQSSTTTPSATSQQQQQQYNNNYSSTSNNNSHIGSGNSSNHCSPSFFEPHSPSMMLLMSSQSPLLNNSLSNNHNQQYYSVGSNNTSQQSSSSSIMGQSGAQRATGTQQLLDVFVNRRKWKEILCVNTSATTTSNTASTSSSSSTNNSQNLNTINNNNNSNNNSGNITTTTTNNNNNENKLLLTPTSSMKGLDSARASSPISPETMSIISASSTEEEETEQTYSTISNYSPQYQPQSSLQQQIPQHVGMENGDDFKLPNSPNENIFRTIVLGGFLSYKDVLKCDLVCRAWHLRISHSKDNFIYFLPQLLSSISVWEEKDELQIMLATQIARNLSHLELSKRMLMVLFGLYRRSLHKEKIFNRAVFKEVLRSEVPDLLGLTDKANMFYKLTSPTWFSPYEYFQCPIYLYLAKRSLRYVEKVDGEFQQRVQVLLKIKYNHEDTPSPSQAFLSLGPPGSGVNSACASPTLSPNVNPTRKLSLVANSPLLRSVDTRTLNDYSPDRTEPPQSNSIVNPPSSPLLNFTTTSTSPSTKQLAQHQSTLTDMINEIKSCWFFAYGTINKELSDLQDRVYPTPSPNNSQHHQNIVTTGHHHHHEKPILVNEKIVKYFSQFSLARMKNEVVFPEDEDCPSPIPFSSTKVNEKMTRITSNIEHCYHEMTQFRNDPHGEYPNIKLAEMELCEQFNGTISKWICELQKLGLYQIEFVLQYVLKLLFFICTGPMYDRSELYFGVTSLHEMQMENDQLDTMCTDPEASREKLKQWILDYRSKHVDSHIYHYYLKIKYECSGFTGGCDEESYLLSLRVTPDFSNFEFVSYLFESRYCKGMAISSLPLFIKKM